MAYPDITIILVFLILIESFIIFEILGKKHANPEEPVIRQNKLDSISAVKAPLKNFALGSQNGLSSFYAELEDEVAESNIKLDSVVSAIDDALIIVDQNGKVKTINSAAQRLLNIDVRTSLGKSIDKILELYFGNKPASFEKNPVLRTIKEQKIFSYALDDSLFCMTANKKLLQISLLTSVLVSNGEPKGAIVLFRDIIGHERELNDLKSTFIAIASHQLRAPLTSVRWFAELLLSGDAGEVEATQKHYLEN